MYANNAGTGYANANIFYLFLGAQPQWGNLWAGYTEVLNWYFPLTTSQVYAVCLTKHTKNISSGHNWEPARIEEWNNSYARIHPDGDLGYSVIAICKAQQQWGINSAGNNGSEGESGWYAFPVNFNSACFALFCGLRNTDTNNPTNYDSEVQPRNWTTTKFNVYKQNYGGNPWFGSFIWFAIGRQPASYKL